ncbi:MAG: hypothetical protein AAGE13_11075 [Pseudomonadota bacterium]
MGGGFALALMTALSARAPLFMVTGVAVGLALPALAQAVRPAVVGVSILMVVLSMLRVDPGRLLAVLRRPMLVAGAAFLSLVVLPVLVAVLAAGAGAPPWLAAGLALAAAAPPLSSAAAFAILVRIDPANVIAISLPATLVAPATVWLVAQTAPGLGEGVEITALVLRLSAIILGAFGLALVLRRVMGPTRIDGLARPLDAAMVVLMVVIGIGVMHDIGQASRADPIAWAGIFLATWALGLASLGLGVALFWPAGRDLAFAAGLCASIKNMAVMVAAVLDTVDPRIALVIVTAQLPIFVAPLVMRPLFAQLRRVGRQL